MTLEAEPHISQRSLSRRVCEWLEWRDVQGKLKEMSCRAALKRLSREGVVALPLSQTFPKRRPAPLYGSPVECSLKDLGPIECIPVDRATSPIWNGLMEHHYLGPGPLCGAQIRYLARSARGWLGALAFSAAAWRVAARDSFMGWTDEERAERLHKVICNSRFLILPWVKVPNLASRLLSLCTGRIREDWNARYGYRPILIETYVEKRFTGTCYKAANWKFIGETRGRGRQDRERTCVKAKKDIYVYPLDDTSCRNVVHMDWAEEEFGGVALKDIRLTGRLLDIARCFYARPQAGIPEAMGTRAGAKAAYRFFDHREASMETLLAAHYESTLTRAKRESVVLAVQDTTTLNYNAHPATENLGPIGYHGLLGLLLHDTMAFTPEGVPLGLMDAQFWGRDPDNRGKKRRRHEIPVEEKESYRWMKSFKKVALAQKRCPRTAFVSVGDREADFYELFQMALSDPSGPKLLVRASHNRVLADEQGHLWERVSACEVSGVQEIHVPRSGARPARRASLEIRYGEVKLKAPWRKREHPPLPVWAVLAREKEGPIEWMLLTTRPVADFADAVEILAWYTQRWGIEIYHRTLKSGCKIEERQLGHADRIEACLAIDMVVAWRIHHLTRLGRETPDVPCTVFFEEAEWKALCVYIRKNPVPPPSLPTLREATRMTASLGGFLGRKCDGEPGTKSLWIGLQRLDDITAMWKLMTGHRGPPVSSRGYG